MRVLIVKLTSMGDLVQALPALTDARRAVPDIEFDWAVDEAFAEIPGWHPAVDRTLLTAHRRWRTWRSMRSRKGEKRNFLAALRQTRYDAVIDAQTNLKSAVVTGLARGQKHGPDARSVREWGAHLVYNRRYAIDKNQLAIARWRQLFSQVLAYPLPENEPDFGLSLAAWPSAAIPLPKSPYLVFVQNASWPNKRWQDAHWRQLIASAATAGYAILLPWGSEIERVQAQSMAAQHPNAQVLPRLSLTEQASVLLGSCGAVCADTGLAHVAAALAVPTVTLYGATDPRLIGATGPRSAHLLATAYPCIPCYARRCEVEGYRGEEAQCMKTISAEQVWNRLTALMGWQSIDLVN